MISTVKREFFLLLAILILSGISFFSFYTGYNTKTQHFNPNDFVVQKHNCYDNTTDQSNQASYTYENGYAYKNDGAYHGWANISQQRTAPNWHVPLHINEGRLQLSAFTQDPGKHFLYFSLPEHKPDQLPLVLLVIDPAELFDPSSGIYVEGNERLWRNAKNFYVKPWTAPANYYLREKGQKRKGFIVFYNEKGNAEFSSVVKIKISGNATASFPQKSLRLESTGTKKGFDFAFFKDSLHYSSVVLRNGGNDWTKTLISDGVMQTAMEPTGLDVLAFRPCKVFINGVYWGIHSIRNRSDEKFIAEKYGVKKKKVTFMENWQLKAGDEDDFKTLMHCINSLKKDKSEDQLKALEELIDIDKFLLYLSAQIYFVNTDWPVNNIKAYRIGKKDKKARWRFILFDLDYGMGYTGPQAVKKDMFEYLLRQKNPMGWIFSALMEHRVYRQRLKETLEKLMQNELSVQNLQRLVKSYSLRIGPYMLNHIQRWRKPGSMAEWQDNLDVLTDFCRERDQVLKTHIVKHLAN